jgi:FkbM family methyltransferase
MKKLSLHKALRIVTEMGRVLTVEPQERLIPEILENLRLNGVTFPSITMKAIAAEAGEKSFFLSPDTNTGTSGFYNTSRMDMPAVTVATQTLSQLLDKAQVQQVALMKIDVEGFEYEVILGSKDVFRARRVKAWPWSTVPASWPSAVCT